MPQHNDSQWLLCLQYQIFWEFTLHFDFNFIIVDSDSDNFQSLKKASKPKQNGSSKSTRSDGDSVRPGAKEEMTSPTKPPSTQGKAGVKHPAVPVTPKSAPRPQPKQTPTSVVDYFGRGTIQRSDKKLVASTKRKAVSTDDFYFSSTFFALLITIKVRVLSYIKSIKTFNSTF